VQVTDGESGAALVGVTVQLVNERLNFDARQTTDRDGQATFDDVQASRWAYEATLSADGYQDASAEIVVEQGENEFSLSLTPQVTAQVTAESANLRSGPGTVYDVVGKVNQDDVLPVIGQSEDGAWLAVETQEGQTGWLSGTLVNVQGQLAQVVALAPPPTPTPIPPTPTAVAAAPAPAPAPPPGAPPLGPNLLVNPGFEDGSFGWHRYRGPANSVDIFTLADYPQFVRSGDKVARLSAVQHVYNVTPGQTYRLGAWARVWSSPDEDRSVSKEPGDISAFVCINIAGDDDVQLETNVCSGGANPVDTWQYLSVDAVASGDHIVVIFIFAVRSGPRHNEVYWDDAVLGLAPVAATPTPLPPAAPTSPQPLPFDGVALRDSMAHLQWVLEQMGGLLDRVYSGQAGSCLEYEDYYAQVIQIATYHSIPGEWQGVYNEYVWSADNLLATNEPIYGLCQSGGGVVSEFNYGLARSGIHDTLARLIPAIATANALLGQ
jgi:uncharacterized protein YgiM (DUF1202 family)